MGVSGDHKLYFAVAEHLLDSWLVATWITADMGHEHIHPLDREFLYLTEATAHIAVVYVAADSPDNRRDRFETAYDIDVAYVTGVPYLVTLGEMLGIAVIPA